MLINDSEKSRHLIWLNTRLITQYCTDGYVQPIYENNNGGINIVLRPQLIGKQRGEGSCKFKYSKLDQYGINIFWTFRENWQRKNRNTFLLTLINICICDDVGKEYLAVHWKFAGKRIEKFQPHWHVNISLNKVHYGKIHFPLSQNWDKYYPKKIESYHRWLQGLLDFFDDEFPRCLSK